MKTLPGITSQLILLVCCFQSVTSQAWKGGHGFEWLKIRNYTKQEYQADIQNWSITQDSNGIMYFGNNEGLLVNYGTDWELFPHPRGLIIRSVAAGNEGRIYFGAYEDLGFFEYDNFGALKYHSLRDSVRDFDFHNQEIWKIIVHHDAVYFQSFTAIFVYRNGHVTTIRSPGIITSFDRIGEQLYTRISDLGFCRLESDQIEPIDTSRFFKETMIRVVLPYQRGKFLIATSENGIFTYNSSHGIEPWNSLQADQLKNTSINRGIVGPDGDYVFGTILSGLFVFDASGIIKSHVLQSNGLQNNTVLSLYLDQNRQIWAGLDNGIDLLQMNTGVSFYNDLEGRIGAVYAVEVYDDIIFAGTNQGLYYSFLELVPGLNRIKLDFKLMPNSQGQVWSLDRFGSQVLCGHNDGTFEVQDLSFKRISNISGGFAMRELIRSKGKFLIQSTYSNLVIYAWKNGKWNFSHAIGDFNNPVKYIEMDHLGNVWASHLAKGLYRLRLNDSLTRVVYSEYMGKRNGFSSDYQINVFKLGNRVVFLNEGKFYTYDDLNDTIVPYDKLNSRSPDQDKIHKIIPSERDTYWLITEKSIHLLDAGKDNSEPIISYPFDYFNNRQIKNFENIISLDSNLSVLCLDNGLCLLPHHAKLNLQNQKKPLIKKIIASGGKPARYLPLVQNSGISGPELQHKWNSICFYVACRVYGTSVRYLYMLDGIDEEWSSSERPEFRYDRLPAGEYSFRCKAIDGWGKETKELSWSFRIRAPWYWSTWTKICYFSAFLLLILLIRRYYLKRLLKQEINLTAEKESEIIKIRNEQLRSEISYKSKELANTTFNIIKKNELLIEIRDALETELKFTSSEQRKSFYKIARLVDRNISNDEDWKVFESNFEGAHEEFLFRIKEEHHLLTPGDLKLCAYLRMNLSTKKIALLQGISVRGVENHRYRLRKKIGLERDENLTEVLMRY